jgi:hypothetical protein
MSIFLPIYNGRKDMSNSPNLLGELSRATANRAAAAQAMHEIVSAPNVAHVVLTDDDESPDRGPPRVTLGDG